MHPIESRAVLHGDVRIALHARGRGPLVVMLPSLGRDADDFHDLAGRLAGAGYRAAYASPRGLGGSVGALHGITLHDYARDVAAVIDAESTTGRAVIVGHAFGNWVARTAAADYPAKVHAVVLAAAGRKGKAAAEIGRAIQTCYEARAPEAERLAALRLAFFAPGNDERVWLDGWDAEIAHAERRAAQATEYESWWRGGTAPILDLQAGNDALLPADQSDKLRTELGERVTVRVIPNAGHALLPEQPAAVGAAVIQYLSGLGRW